MIKSLYTVFSTVCVTLMLAEAQVPSWTAPALNPLLPYGGSSLVNGTTWTQVYRAVPAIGTYNHAVMLDYHDSQFLLTWKNSPQDEDQNGQRVLYSQSLDGVTWTPTDSNNIMFPNMSTNSFPVHLFAEPAVHINGSYFAAASPKQFCLYPDQYFSLLLLRRVITPGLGKFGPIFWASPKIPPGFEPVSNALGIVTVAQMDAQTQAEVAMLASPTFKPCGPVDTDYTLKCEWCLNGCQPWNETTNVTTIENERTHYVVPGSHPQADVILYRSHGNLLHASTRTAPDGPWTTPPAITNITDDVSNINAGVLPDGRVFLVSNAMLNIFRDPLFISLSSDGWHFDATRVVASCEQDVFVAPDQPWGCLYRYPGGAKEGGVQYPQALVVTKAGVEGVYVAFSNGKEDIWVAHMPFAF